MPRRQPTPESARDRLLRLLRNADSRSPAVLSKWLLDLSETDQNEWESFRSEFIQCDPIQCVSGPKMRDYFIVLMHQHGWFKNECQRLQQQIAHAWNETTEGAGYLPVLRAMSKDEHESASLDARIARLQAEYRRRKQSEEAQEELANSKRKMKLLRSRKPEQPLPVNWCQPMPVTSVKEPLGYCQATAQHERKVLDFLGEKKLLTKRTTPLPHPGRGAPLKLRSVTTNLRVLDVWLGEWLPQEPKPIANAILNTLFWQATEKADDGEVNRFRKLLLKHWRRIKDKLTDAEILAESPSCEKAMTDAAAWATFVERAKNMQRHSEKLHEIAKKPGKAPNELIGFAQRIAKTTLPHPPTQIV